MGTVSYGFESMDEVAHQLHVAFGSGDKGKASVSSSAFVFLFNSQDPRSAQKTDAVDDRCPARDSWATRHVFKGEGRRVVSRSVS